MATSCAPHVTRQVLLLASVGSLVAYLLQFMFPTLAVIIARGQHQPVATVLSWSFGGYLFFGLGALPGGYLTDRIGARRALLVGLAGMGVSALAVAEATPGRSLALCLSMLGFFGGFHFPAAMRSLARIDGSQRGRYQWVPGSAGALGLALAPVITFKLGQTSGPRDAYTVAGYCVCALAAVLGMWRMDLDEDPPVLPAAPAVRTPGTHVPLTIAASLSALGVQAVAIRMPSHLATQPGVLNFGLLASLVYGLALIGWPVGADLLRQYETRTLMAIVPAASLLPLLLLGHVGDHLIVVVAAGAATCGAALQSIHTQLLIHATPMPRNALAYGIRFAVIAGTSSLALPLIAWSAASPSILFDAVAVLMALSAIAGVRALARTRSATSTVEPELAAPKQTTAVSQSVG